MPSGLPQAKLPCASRANSTEALGTYASAQAAAVAIRVAERQQHVSLERANEVAPDALAAVGHRTALPSREARGDGAGRRHTLRPPAGTRRSHRQFALWDKFGKFRKIVSKPRRGERWPNAETALLLLLLSLNVSQDWGVKQLAPMQSNPPFSPAGPVPQARWSHAGRTLDAR